jgi:hypothetical protein
LKERKSTRKVIVFLIITILVCSFSIYLDVSANPIPVYDQELEGMLAPADIDHNITFTSAKVVFDVYTQKSWHLYFIDFTGIYQFRNKGESINLFIANPLIDIYNNRKQDLCSKGYCHSDFSLTVNDTYQTVDIYTYPDEEVNYFQDYFDLNSEVFVISDVHFPGNSSLVLKYTFTGTLTKKIHAVDHINYIVGTGRAWKDSYFFNETVTFRVKGLQPDWTYRYLDGIPNNEYTNYTWNFIFGNFETDEVFISYRTYKHFRYIEFVKVLAPIAGGLIYLIGLIVHANKKSKIKS